MGLFHPLAFHLASQWNTLTGGWGDARGEWGCSVSQSCLTLCDPMECSPPGSSVHGIFQARILEQVAISFSRGEWGWVFIPQPLPWKKLQLLQVILPHIVLLLWVPWGLGLRGNNSLKALHSPPCFPYTLPYCLCKKSSYWTFFKLPLWFLPDPCKKSDDNGDHNECWLINNN